MADIKMNTVDEISRKEHLLATIAQSILEHQHELKALKQKEDRLEANKPRTDKERISYEEALHFGERVREYEKHIDRIEQEIIKKKRELNALTLQAKKLLPVSQVQIKVSTEDELSQTFSIEYIEPKDDTPSAGNLKVEQL